MANYFASSSFDDPSSDYLVGTLEADVFGIDWFGGDITGLDGSDVAVGGKGNDQYWLALWQEGTLDASLIEAAGEGVDTVYVVDSSSPYDEMARGPGGESSTQTYTLGANFENFEVRRGYPGELITSTSPAVFFGEFILFGEPDWILTYANWDVTGNELGNNIVTSVGNDVLDGGAGADTMVGGRGSDTYYVDNVGDKVVETGETTGSSYGGVEIVSAYPEVDVVVSSLATYTAANFVEAVSLSGKGNNTAIGNALDNMLDGNDGNNKLQGMDGDDELMGNGGSDTLDGGNGNDIMDGGVGADSMSGGAGDDAFVAEEIYDPFEDDWFLVRTADTMVGGLGDDSYFVDSAADVVTEAAAGGNDTVITTLATYSLASLAQVESLIAADDELTHFNFKGNALNNRLVGGSEADVLDGDAGNDVLEGGDGRNTLIGGLGDDTFVLNGSDVVVEAASGGIDTVIASANATLAANVENLMLIGTAISGTGNAGNNKLVGNAEANSLTGDAGDDVLDGGAGADLLRGGLGSDTYYIDSRADRVREFHGEGIDMVFVQTDLFDGTSYTLDFNIDNATLIGNGEGELQGNALANKLVGNAAGNFLYGGKDTVVDTLEGKGGDDWYLVRAGDSATDIVTEQLNEGIDTVMSMMTTYALTANVENGEVFLAGNGDLTGNALANELTGNNWDNILSGLDGNDKLFGRGGFDRLAGGGGDDLLDGGTGDDFMTGGLGNDTFVLDHALDRVRELSAEAGIDTLRLVAGSSQRQSINLNDADTQAGGSDYRGIEHVEVYHDGSSDITGNALANKITAGVGNDELIGGLGNDTIDGGGGSDLIFGGDGLDVIYVSGMDDGVDAGTGVDTVIVADWFDATAQDIAQDGKSIENFQLAAGTGVAVMGNAANNRIDGNARNNLIDGELGADTMIGGAGNDIYGVSQATDVVTELAGGGIDAIHHTYMVGGVLNTQSGLRVAPVLATTYVLPNFVEIFGDDLSWRTATEARDDSANSNEIDSDDVAPEAVIQDVMDASYRLNITGNAENNLIFGTYDAQGHNLDPDSLIGGADTLATQYDGANKLDGGLGDDILVGLSGDDTLIGGAGNDILMGDDSGDQLDGTAMHWADVLHGGAGNDFYFIDSTLDQVWDTPTIGIDTTDGGGIDSLWVSGQFSDGDGNVLEANFTMDGNRNSGVIRGGMIEHVYLGEMEWNEREVEFFNRPDTVQSYVVTGNALNNTIYGSADIWIWDEGFGEMVFGFDVAHKIYADAGDDVIVLNDYWVDMNNAWETTMGTYESMLGMLEDEGDGHTVNPLDDPEAFKPIWIRSSISEADRIDGDANPDAALPPTASTRDVLHAAIEGVDSSLLINGDQWIQNVEEIHFYTVAGDNIINYNSLIGARRIYIHDSLLGESGSVQIDNLAAWNLALADDFFAGIELRDFTDDFIYDFVAGESTGNLELNVRDWQGALLNDAAVGEGDSINTLELYVKGGENTIDLSGAGEIGSIQLLGSGTVKLNLDDLQDGAELNGVNVSLKLGSATSLVHTTYNPVGAPTFGDNNNAQIDLDIDSNTEFGQIDTLSIEVLGDSSLDISGIDLVDAGPGMELVNVTGTGNLTLTTMIDINATGDANLDDEYINYNTDTTVATGDLRVFSSLTEGDLDEGWNGLFLGGGDGNDELVGAAGDDFLYGGAGDFNVLTGGADADIFMLDDIGFSVLTDFTQGEDHIDLNQLGFMSTENWFQSGEFLDTETTDYEGNTTVFFEQSSGMLYYSETGVFTGENFLLLGLCDTESDLLQSDFYVSMVL